MYFVFYFIAGIILFFFFLFKFIGIIYDKRGYSSFTNKVYALLLFLVMIATLLNISIAIMSYRKTINMTGLPGDKGIDGEKGKKGQKGKCNDTCGQKVCYIDILDEINITFQEEVEKLLVSGAYKDNINFDTRLNKEDFVVKNGFFLDKLNSICKSDQYQSIMLGKHPNKPNERKLINYLKEIFKDWIIYLVKDPKKTGCLLNETRTGNNPNSLECASASLNGSILIEEEHKGVKFLLEKNFTEDLLNFDINNISYNPFEEFRKYDIWNWGDGIKIKPLQIKVTTNKLNHPEPDVAPLQIIKTNNYKWVFDTSTRKDIWDDSNCEYGQMGPDNTNPQNLRKCVFINNNNYLKEYVNTWKTEEFTKDSELSLYHPLSFKDPETNQEFYPVGSVWRGSEKRKKPKGSVRVPPSQNHCGIGHGNDRLDIATDEGPEKNTILVSGDVKKPVSMTLLWDSREGCDKCQINYVRIYRPIAPEGYVALGDYAKQMNAQDSNTDITDEDLNKIRCVPIKSVRELRLGNKVYENKKVAHHKYNNYLSYASKKPFESNNQLSTSFWCAGMDGLGVSEEQRNLHGVDFQSDNGYNLFRVGRGFRKPTLKTYVIKQEYLSTNMNKRPPKKMLLDASKHLSDSDNRYNAKEYFGKKPPFAILTNKHLVVKEDNTASNSSYLNFEKKPIKLYLEDDGNRRKSNDSDTYFLRTYNLDRNDFSNYIVSNINGEIEITSKPSKRNKYHRWIVNNNNINRQCPENTNTDTDTNTNTSVCKSPSEQKFNFDIMIESYGLKKDNKANIKLYQYYDSNAKSHFKLTNNVGGSPESNWRYSSPLWINLPQYCEC